MTSLRYVRVGDEPVVCPGLRVRAVEEDYGTSHAVLIESFNASGACFQLRLEQPVVDELIEALRQEGGKIPRQPASDQSPWTGDQHVEMQAHAPAPFDLGRDPLDSDLDRAVEAANRRREGGFRGWLRARGWPVEGG